MKLRQFVRCMTSVAVVCVTTGAAANESAESFLQQQHSKITTLLRQPASGTRDAQVNSALESFVDFKELSRRTFGEPCPPSVPKCTDHWAELKPEQRDEVTELLRKLVEKNYRKNLIKTLDYEVTFKGAREFAGDAKVRTEAKSKLSARDPAVEVDYIVKTTSQGFRVVDIVTEGSSMAKNYYDQFHRMLTTPEQGYGHIVKKLTERVAKKD